MQGILEIYGDYRDEGVMSRKITEGKEIELVRSYISYRKEQFNNKNCSCNKNLAIFLEPKVDNAYPDIVFVEYNPESYENWNETRNNLLKEDLKILYHIYATRGQNASELVLQLGVSWKGLMLTIERLNDAGLIYRENQQWQVKDISKISTYGIEAVEAKMNQWNQVLQQSIITVSYTHLRAHETRHDIVCRLLLEKKKKKK